MSDVMNIQKVFSPISPTQRVRRLKKEYPDSQERRFEGDLEEEKDGEKNEKQGAPTLERTKAHDEKEKREEENFTKGSADPDADMKNRNSHGRVGSLVDIRV